jgi:putative mycofactocin binding protein MftB
LSAEENDAVSFDLDARWRLHPRVSVRPERFGALLYSFDTRKLSFLKTPQLLEVVEALADAPTARAACERAGVEDSDLPAIVVALSALAQSQMICSESEQPTA